MSKQYEKRDEYFELWIRVCSVEMPIKPIDRSIMRDGLRRAFNAGWAARKCEVDYSLPSTLYPEVP